MARLWLTVAALLASGCFVDSLGLPPPSGGAPSGGAGGDPAVEGGSLGVGGAISSGGGDGGAPIGGAPPQHCPPGEVATDIDKGTLACAPIADAVTKAIADSCTVFYGWRDSCDVSCTTGPDRFGSVTGTTCTEPPTGDSSCQVHDLGADLGVQLFGLDLDGNADGGDRFYGAIRCAEGAAGTVPCNGAGFVTSYAGGTAACGRISAAVLDYVRPSCALVRGWRDQCDDCGLEPSKYVTSTTLTCDAGVGGYCAELTIDADTVRVASFDTDGNVDDDDKLHFGLRCETVTSAESTARNACPEGQFVVGLEADGSLVCSDLREASMTVFRERCALFAGWRDGCDACTDAPTKWGRVRDGDCINNGAADDTCSTMTLGDQTVNLYGLNLDGDVNGNDKLHIGFRCE